MQGEFFDYKGKIINRSILDQHMASDLTLNYASKGTNYTYMYMLNPLYHPEALCKALQAYMQECNPPIPCIRWGEIELFSRTVIKNVNILNYIQNHYRILEEYYKYNNILEPLMTHPTKFNFLNRQIKLAASDFTIIASKFSLT